MSQAWMPLYVGDYLADTRRLSTLEHGAYLLLIMDYWQNRSLPTNEAALARIAGLSTKEWSAVRKAVAPLFQDGWKHRRIDAELHRSDEKSQSARTSAAASWRSRRNANADANALPAQSDGICGQHAHARVSQPQPQKIRDADASLVDETVAAVPVDVEKPEKTALRIALQAFGEAWNELAWSLRLPAIDEIKPGSTRERHALARLREIQDPDGVLGLMARIRGSPYLRGEVNGFRCTFDWLVNASNFQKIMEGNYEDRKITKISR